MEYNDIYDKQRNRTGQVHLRGTRWKPGEYGLVVCVWVHDGKGNVLMTRRAKEKTFAGTWENSGGAARAGETSRQAIVRELFEETGIRAQPEDFSYLCSGRDKNTHYDFYTLYHPVELSQVVLQPGETDDVAWYSLAQVHELIDRKMICRVIARQFLKQEPLLKKCQIAQE